MLVLLLFHGVSFLPSTHQIRPSVIHRHAFVLFDKHLLTYSHDHAIYAPLVACCRRLPLHAARCGDRRFLISGSASEYVSGDAVCEPCRRAGRASRHSTWRSAVRPPAASQPVEHTLTPASLSTLPYASYHVCAQSPRSFTYYVAPSNVIYPHVRSYSAKCLCVVFAILSL